MKEIVECMGSITIPEGWQHIFDLPEVRVVDSCGPKIGGSAKDGHTIEISSWITVDKNESLVVVVHEEAHILNQRVHGKSKDPHGEEFERILRFVAGQDDWERYKGWRPNNYIEDLRLLLHPRSVRLT